jgi:Fe-S-cluster containining protein
MAKPSSSLLVDSELAARFSLGVIELFQAEPSSAQIQAVAESAFYWADYCLNLLETATPLPKPPACQPGCDSCCYNQVELTTPEALLLGSYLATRFPAERLQSFLTRVETSVTRRAGKTKVQLAAIRAELPCPLLEAGCCLVYEVRPLMCRAMHSLELDACRRELADPDLNLVEFYSHRHIINVSISQGLIDACLALGFQPGPVDLILAIQQYFSHPDFADRWLAGEKVFHD